MRTVCTTERQERIAEHLRAQPDLADFALPEADYNVAPTTFQPIVRQSREVGDREMVLARRGSCSFLHERFEGRKRSLHDQRSGGVNHKGSDLAGACKKRRCLVLASAFYEWPREGKPPKQPYAFELQSDGLFAFAGLWDA
jgi:putative SOS response-associated peptidase YedK